MRVGDATTGADFLLPAMEADVRTTTDGLSVVSADRLDRRPGLV